MKRVEAASGAKYSTHNEPTRKFEPIAPVGTNYTPVGKVDIAALKKTPAPVAKPALPTRPIFGAPATSAGSLYGKAASSGSASAWLEEKTTEKPHPPASTRPLTVQTTIRPAFSAMTPTKPSPGPISALGSTPSSRSGTHPAPVTNTPIKPAEEDRIEPNKSAWTPVNLPAPKKLKNPFAAMEQQTLTQQGSPTPSAVGASKKLTWSERQALAKKQAEEEEAKSRAAGFKPPAAAEEASKPVFKSTAPSFGKASIQPNKPRNFGAVPEVASAGVDTTGIATTSSVSAPVFTPLALAATRTVPVQPSSVEEPEPEVGVNKFN